MQDFRNISAEAYGLCRRVYEDMRESGNFRLKDQLFGAVTSIPAHLAELAAYDSGREKLIRLRRCIGEANEAEFWLNFCRSTGELSKERAGEYMEKLVEVRRMLYGLKKKIENES